MSVGPEKAHTGVRYQDQDTGRSLQGVLAEECAPKVQIQCLDYEV